MTGARKQNFRLPPLTRTDPHIFELLIFCSKKSLLQLKILLSALFIIVWIFAFVITLLFLNRARFPA